MIKNYKLTLTILLVSYSLLHGMEPGESKLNFLQKKIQTSSLKLYEELEKDKMDTENIKKLLNEGADPSRKIKKTNGLHADIYVTPLQNALDSGTINLSLIDLLLETVFNTGDVPFRHPVFEFPEYNIKEYPIYYLVKSDKTIEEKIAIIRLMKKYGFNISRTNTRFKYSGNTLHTICGADFSVQFTPISSDIVDNYKIAEELIINGIDVNEKDTYGNTPAHCVACTLCKKPYRACRKQYEEQYLKNHIKFAENITSI